MMDAPPLRRDLWSLYASSRPAITIALREQAVSPWPGNLLIAAEIQAASVCAVPNVYWFRLEDLERYVGWCKRAVPPAIATNLQTFRSQRDWEEMALPGLSYLAALLPQGVRVVLTGASRAERISELAQLFGERLVLVSQNPLQYARHGALMTPSGRVDHHARTEDLFAANVRYYAGLVEAGDGRG